MPVFPGAVPYDRFEDLVGEPRGVGTQPVIGSQAGYYPFVRFTRPFDWVLTSNILSFTEN